MENVLKNLQIMRKPLANRFDLQKIPEYGMLKTEGS